MDWAERMAKRVPCDDCYDSDTEEAVADYLRKHCIPRTIVERRILTCQQLRQGLGLNDELKAVNDAHEKGLVELLKEVDGE